MESLHPVQVFLSALFLVLLLDEFLAQFEGAD